jgi:ubiquitin C
MSLVFAPALETFRGRVTTIVSAGFLSDGKPMRPAEVAELVQELFQFLTLKVLKVDTDATELAPSPQVDKAWQELIIATKFYHELCATILPPSAPSPRILHRDAHGLDPNTRYVRTLDMYKAAFGGEAPRKWWPGPPIEITVQTMHGGTLTLKDIDPSSSVCELKQIFQARVGIPPVHQTLAYNGTEMEDGRSLVDYGVQEKSVIRVSWPAQAAGPSDSSTLFGVDCTPKLVVRTLAGLSISLTYDPTDSVFDLKQKVRDKEGTPPDQQRLIFMGRQLVDEMKLADYSFQENSTLHLMVKLKGC